MTHLDVTFRYGAPPRESTLRAIDHLKEVYGIRRIDFSEKERTVRVEFDASRLTDSVVSALLLRAGLDVQEKVQLV